MKRGRKRIIALYYITHINNIPSILERGILSHERIEQDNIETTPIYDQRIVSNHRERTTPDGRSLWSYANLYFQPRNPMMYRIKFGREDDIAVLSVRPDVLNTPGVFVANGNAANHLSDILPVHTGIDSVKKMQHIIDSEWWREEDGSKRKIMAECLVPDSIPPDYIQAIYVPDHTVSGKLKDKLPAKVLPVPEPHMFFRPRQTWPLTSRLTLVDGDMFFSRMQTLTISVNCVGVMGKGLASRAKHQFPDVYVYYQELCRNKTLHMGKPHLYKRETPLDYQLVDEPLTTDLNTETWFLLFPTKRHWREKADVEGIKTGLQWLQDNYQHAGIKSLALPALGCGLGGIEWREMGPLLCSSLSKLDIPVWVYLPRETQIPPELLSQDFLLS